MAFRVTQLITINPVEIGGPPEADHLVVVVSTHATLSAAEAALRELTRKTAAFNCATERVAPEARERFLEKYLSSPLYLTARCYFIGDPPIDDIRAALAKARQRVRQKAAQ